LDLSPQNFQDNNFTYTTGDKTVAGMWFGDIGRIGTEVRV
jgi:hypothetical protein